MSKVQKETPLMKQYNAIKHRYPDAILLFRVGDFYETFGEDAVKASQTLDIVLTKRANGVGTKIDLAGFPHHSLDAYLPKLIRAGYRVAICDQLEDPKMVKGIVKRGVTELVTPGLSFHENVLEKGKNNYLASVYRNKTQFGISFLDLSTGEFLVATGSEDYVDKLLKSFFPSEVIFSKSQKKWYFEKYGEQYPSCPLEDWIFSSDFSYDKLIKHFQVNNLKGFGIEEFTESYIAAGAILHYLDETQHKEIQHINYIARIDANKYVWLDRFTISSLELLSPAQHDGVTLLDILNQTSTSMGNRLLRKWIVLPLKSKLDIEQRLNAIEVLIEKQFIDQMNKNLKNIMDIERLAGKIASNRINPRELVSIKRSLDQIKAIKCLIEKESSLSIFNDLLNPCSKLYEKLDTFLQEDVSLQIHRGNIIKKGINQELDELRVLQEDGKESLNKIKEREVKRTGISSLKVSFNKIFGYYLEVSNTHTSKVPPEWIRKQTLVNAERYITQELKEYEDKILDAESRILELEQQLFNELVEYTYTYIELLQQNSKIIAQLDCLNGFAKLASAHNYVKPTITKETSIEIKNGRHPVIEQTLPKGDVYVTNNIRLDNLTQQIMVITGPNMSGKSAFLRQTALITLMAQIGSFVPASYAKIGLVDKIFTRVGASDNLSKGESTFMIEMTETASILNNLSENSLILMDEIGRGTSTYDGISIAWSIVEHLHNHPKYKPKTLFATHYHELSELANHLPRVSNSTVSVKELDEKVIFMRKLVEGTCTHSFGIHVAKMAGIPNEIIFRANEMLKQLENSQRSASTKNKVIQKTYNQTQLFTSDPKLEKVMELIKGLDINTVSPVEALLKLNELKQIFVNS